MNEQLIPVCACANVEAERLRLNARWAIANSAARCLGHYLERYRRARLTKSLGNRMRVSPGRGGVLGV